MTDDIEIPEGQTVEPTGAPEAPDDGLDEIDDEDEEVEGDDYGSAA